MAEKKRAARYALRRTLPPWCFDERLEELLEFCQQAHVDEVIIKVDTEEFSHGIPTVEWVEAYMPKLERARDALRGVGVEFSINPWVTVGHLDRGRNLEEVFPDFDWMVGHGGKKCKACACPLSTGWRKHTKELWRMYASLKPNVMWVEDDIRTFNHTPIEYGCFCDLHLKAFSERIGKEVTREGLVDVILQPGKPHPWRSAWLDFLRDAIEEMCSFLAKVVHEVSPETHLGLMSSGPATHCLEGRDWVRLAEKLGDGKAIYSRPTLGNYSESSLTGLYYSAAQIKRTRHVLPEGTIEQTEVENALFTGYSKSALFTFLQIALSVSHGCDGATLNLFDHAGSPMSLIPEIGEMLSRNRRYIDELAESHCPPGVFKGVGILHHEKASYVRELSEGDDYGELAPPDYVWEEALNSLGIATTYAGSPIIAASGQTIGTYEDDEIKKMLSGGLLLDLTAVETLIGRGFGEQIGVMFRQTLGLHETLAISTEELTDPEFAGAKDRYLTATIPGLIGNPRFGIPQLDPKARVLSRLVDPDRNIVCDFVSIFENEFGGRVAVFPIEMRDAFGPAFLHPWRGEQLRAVLKWLAQGKLPSSVEGGVYALPYRMDFPGRMMLGVFNLSHDDWPIVEWHVYLGDSPPSSVETLTESGKWENADTEIEETGGGTYKISLRRKLKFRIPLILRVNQR